MQNPKGKLQLDTREYGNASKTDNDTGGIHDGNGSKCFNIGGQT